MTTHGGIKRRVLNESFRNYCMGCDTRKRSIVQSLPQGELEPPKEFPNTQKTHVIGPGPLKTDESGRPLNTSACLFLASKGLAPENYLISSRPNHRVGAFKMAAILAYKNGKGVDIPSLGVKKGEMPSEDALEKFPDIFMGKSLLEGAQDVRKNLAPAAGEYLTKAMQSYVPLIIRGAGSQTEVCVRVDPNVSIENAQLAIKVLREGANVADSRIKVVASRNDDAEKVRDHFEGRGELWRLYPPTRTAKDQIRYIESSKMHTGSGTLLYYCAGTGERLLTSAQISNMADSFIEGESDREKISRQLSELSHLGQSTNRDGMPELAFHMVDEEKFPKDEIILAENFASDKSKTDDDVKQMLIGLKSRMLAATSGGFFDDDFRDPEKRRAMYNRLAGQSSLMRPEEMKLGLSKVFMGEIDWLAGATVIKQGQGDKLIMHPDARPHTRAIIEDYYGYCNGHNLKLKHINMGQVVDSLSKREERDPDENREVYVVEWSATGDNPRENQVDLLRRQRYDAPFFMRGMHFDSGDGVCAFKSATQLKKLAESGAIKEDDAGKYMILNDKKAYGRRLSKKEAQELTLEYRDFTLDRELFESVLFSDGKIKTESVSVPDQDPKTGPYETFFFLRSYIRGTAVDKIPEQKYADTGFAAKVASLMGVEAARTLACGRINRFTGEHVFGDGDEIIRFDRPVEEDGSNPLGYVRPYPTSVLGDVKRDPKDYAKAYALWLSKIVALAGKNSAGNLTSFARRTCMAKKSWVLSAALSCWIAMLCCGMNGARSVSKATSRKCLPLPGSCNSAFNPFACLLTGAIVHG